MGVPRAELNVMQRVDRWLTLHHREWMRYQRYGLLLDDIMNDEDPVVIEALNRLPKAVKDARERRIIRVRNMKNRDGFVVVVTMGFSNIFIFIFVYF